MPVWSAASVPSASRFMQLQDRNGGGKGTLAVMAALLGGRQVMMKQLLLGRTMVGMTSGRGWLLGTPVDVKALLVPM